jgi:hypothetical protein
MPKLSSKEKPLRLSPSSLGDFRSCPRCFWLRFRKGIEAPACIFPSLPSGMDKILKAHFDSFRQKGALPPELSSLSGYRLFDNLDLLNVWRNNLRGIQYADEKAKAILRGAVDEVLTKGKKLVVLDFKTRGFALKEDTTELYQSQLDIYTYLLEKNSFDTERYAYLLFYHPNKVNADGSVLFNTDLVKMQTDPARAEVLFRSAVKLLHSAKPPASAEECDNCRFVKERRGQ